MKFAPLALLPLALAACRGDPADQPPMHLIMDMRNQAKYRPEGESAFFADKRAMRAPVEGTIAQGQLFEDQAFYKGRTEQGFLLKSPQEVSESSLRRGQERFNIYCSPCHDRTGTGRGLTVQRGFPPPVDLNGERVRNFADGEIFNVITRGVRNMPSYAAQIPEEDRWKIVAWVRVLQRSQHGSLADVPPEQREQIEPEAK